MASLSQDDRAVITKHLLDDSLDHLQVSLQKTEQSYDGAGDTRDQGPPKAVSILISTLLGHEVALTLRSKTGAGDLASELFNLVKRVRNGYFNYQQYRPLLRLVVKKAPDLDI